MLSRWPEPIPNKKIPLGRACDQSVGEEIAEIGSRSRVRRAIRGCEYLAVACDGAFRWGKGQVGSSSANSFSEISDAGRAVVGACLYDMKKLSYSISHDVRIMAYYFRRLFFLDRDKTILDKKNFLTISLCPYFPASS